MVTDPFSSSTYPYTWAMFGFSMAGNRAPLVRNVSLNPGLPLTPLDTYLIATGVPLATSVALTTFPVEPEPKRPIGSNPSTFHAMPRSRNRLFSNDNGCPRALPIKPAGPRRRPCLSDDPT